MLSSDPEFDVVGEADDGLDAIECVENLTPDLVLMDVHLNGANGIKLVEVMRHDDAWRDIPVILVTSDRQRSTICHAADVNVQGYVLKPYEPAFLIRKIRAVLEKSPGSGIAAPSQPAC